MTDLLTPDNIRCFDLETTGTDTDTAEIVEIAITDPNGAALLETLVRPVASIPADVVAVHGITNEMVADALPFQSIAENVQRLLEDAILVTYCGRSFDAVIVDRELRSAGQAGLDLDNTQEIDLYQVWKELEPRTLAGALVRYGVAVPDAVHRALADTALLPLLLQSMRDVHGTTTEEMMAITRPATEVDRSGKLRRAEDGQVVFAFGKHEGVPVRSKPDYCEWMLGRDFASDTKRALRAILRGS
ncbi:hypothetical protein LCGC14_2694210 [marine sediment metagenome]|uniref:Exonuclease domain-containing protein n=1 Tax=marine sediment metagenome TaxID=412755 RepID=A0A0F8ZHL2_9ZZZZ